MADLSGLNVPQLAETVRRSIVEVERLTQTMAQVKTQTDSIERAARAVTEGRNAQEREDHVAAMLVDDQEHRALVERIDALRLRRAEALADIDAAKMLARYATALLYAGAGVDSDVPGA